MTRAWAELLRLPALFTVPGDALTGAAATGVRPNRRTLLAITSSLCLYEAGMALNDWADRTEDALERPHRPLPSGRIKPAAALTAAGALTVTGLALASRAGRPALAVAAPLAATVWAYDLALKHTPAGPAAMATARALDLLLGAAATTGRIRPAIPSATALGTHTFAVTAVSRHETRGGTPLPALAALTTTAALMWHVGRGRRGESGTVGGGGANAWDALGVRDTPGVREVRLRVPVTPGAGEALRARDALGVRNTLRAHEGGSAREAMRDHQALRSRDALRIGLALVYGTTSARPLFHAVLNPSPPLTQRAVGAGIRAMIPLQAALGARSGSLGTALLTAALAPAARRFGRKVSVT